MEITRQLKRVFEKHGSEIINDHTDVHLNEKPYCPDGYRSSLRHFYEMESSQVRIA